MPVHLQKRTERYRRAVVSAHAQSVKSQKAGRNGMATCRLPQEEVPPRKPIPSRPPLPPPKICSRRIQSYPTSPVYSKSGRSCQLKLNSNGKSNAQRSHVWSLVVLLRVVVFPQVLGRGTASRGLGLRFSRCCTQLNHSWVGYCRVMGTCCRRASASRLP